MGIVKWYFDTSVLVAALVEIHPHHQPAVALLEESIGRRVTAYMSTHGLTELYSVLTRTPFKPPISPALAWQLIEESILPNIERVTLTPREHTELLRTIAKEGVAGGRVYDAIHIECARKTTCDRIYTFNVRNFRALAPVGVIDKIAMP